MTDTPPTLSARIKDTATGMAMYMPIALARCLPYRWRVPVMGWITSRLVAPVAGYDRRVRENLAHVLPTMPPHKARRLSKRVSDNFGRNLIELYSPDEFVARCHDIPVEGPGLQTIREEQAAGRPVIFVTGHIGNFNALRVAMIREGCDFGVFYRPLSNTWFNRRYIAAMGTISQPMFQQGRRGMSQMVRHLRRGGTLAILNDLNAHDGVPLDFFGKPALTSLVTAEMALKFNALLVPGWCLRQANGLDFRVVIEAPLPHSDPVTMTRQINDRLEKQVRRNMDQWLWIHRRWKDATGPLAEGAAQKLRSYQRQAESGDTG